MLPLHSPHGGGFHSFSAPKYRHTDYRRTAFSTAFPSSLDMECWILDIRQRVQGKMVLPQNHFVQNELPQFIFIAATNTSRRIRAPHPRLTPLRRAAIIGALLMERNHV
ncbi:MAG: hypothetical protein NTV22_19605 [bacterium]|nr:hypothetical protein [bacterium]